MNAIYILWLRQIKRYFRSKARIVGSIGQPLLFLVALGFGFGPVFAKAGEGDYLAFLSPGIIAMSILFTAVFNGIEIIWDRQFGFLKETLVAPVSRLNIMVGRTLGGATVALLQGLIVLAITIPLGFKPNILNLPLALVFMILIALFFTGLGTAIASLLEDMQGFQLIMNFIIMPVFFLSGALFPADGLPSALKYVLVGNPLAYGIDGLRAALVGGAHFGMGLDFLVLGIITTIILGIGSYLFTKIQI
ncbi:MAG: ABC transporter permease [Patescibacteria group bacterium]|nr:ABC transporter permease [Patescibacteria group bacterium]MDD5295005.1 ABC transporter permease [Patescibacteria group bacterium]MDD5554351.1 ABC transporter permease [Patescibacteria group bacterium]